MGRLSRLGIISWTLSQTSWNTGVCRNGVGTYLQMAGSAERLTSSAPLLQALDRYKAPTARLQVRARPPRSRR